MKAEIHFVPLSPSKPANLVAEAEILFYGGILGGCKLVGFSVWKSKKDSSLWVSVPSRPYTSGGTTKYFELVRDQEAENPTDIKALKDNILTAYKAKISGVPDNPDLVGG